MDWMDIETDGDVEKLFERVEHFHDWYVAGYSYDPLGSCEDGDLGLSRLKDGLDALVVTFRWDCVHKGRWPEVQMKFDEVRAFNISLGWLQEGCPLYEAFLEKTDHGWVLAGDGPLNPEERERPTEVKANLLVVSNSVKWRPLAVVTSDGPDWWDE